MNKYRIIVDELLKKLNPKPVTKSVTTSVETKPSRRAKPPDLKILRFNGSHLE